MLKKRIFKYLTSALVFLTVLLIGVTFGYFIKESSISFIDNLVFRVERKIGKLLGHPTETEKLVRKVETTFVELHGKVFTLPKNDYINGGALTVWGDEILIIARDGTIYFLKDDEKIVRSSIEPPKNGYSAYQKAASSEKYAQYRHKFNQFRFNDIEFISSESLNGLATSYTFYDAARECYGTRISWLEIASGEKVFDFSASEGDWETVFQTKPCLPLNPEWTALDGQLAGGRIAFSPPSTLYLGSGDYHLDGIHTYDAGVQSDESSYGKVIAIDLSSRASRVVSKGHRNMQGVAVDERGRVWVTEHGVRGGDELNLIVENENYGWPLESLGTLYSGQPFPDVPYGRHEKYRTPVYAWLPSAAISSLAYISGLDESWDGDLLAGSLSSAEYGQSLFHIRIKEDRVVFVERIRLRQRVRHLIQSGPSEIAVWLDSNELVLFEVTRRPDPLTKTREQIARRFDVEMAASILQTLESCSECHSFQQLDNLRSPTLNGVFGRNIASTDYEGYSDALKSVAGSWTKDNLVSFLTDPTAFAPGTTMPAVGLTDNDLLKGVIHALELINSGEEKHLTYN